MIFKRHTLFNIITYHFLLLFQEKPCMIKFNTVKAPSNRSKYTQMCQVF